MKINKRDDMDRYFNLDVMKFERPRAEMEYLSGQLRSMNKEDLSEVIDNYALDPLQVYVSKHKRLENKFSFSTIEPFMNYLDRYLIERSGGNIEELKKLSILILGEELDYPTARLMRMGILNNYFDDYLV